MRVIATLEESVRYAEGYIAEDDVISAARSRSDDLRIPAVSPGGGAVLRFLAAVTEARNVVEVGTGAGVSGLWLLRGMTPDGVLTSVDIEGEHLRQARESFAAAGVAPQRTRLITGRALDVLPRLADGAYDLVVIDGPAEEWAACLDEGLRLLRPQGVIAVLDAIGDGAVADPARRGADVLARRALLTSVREDERLVPMLLPAGTGVLAAAVR